MTSMGAGTLPVLQPTMTTRMTVMRDVAVYVLVDPDEMTMLMEWRTPPWPPYDLWCFGSGLIENGEAPAKAVARELKERLGAWPLQLDDLPVVVDPSGRQFFPYLVTDWQGRIATTNKGEGYPLAWFKLTMLPSVVNDVTRAIHMAALDRISGGTLKAFTKIEVEAVA